ncbi:hypothetical protein MTBLM5_100064 [Magnetospirillum sp. LM-5]|nr:hypothetical protein MTBLM5_100064 [Magnetospirillum sp. LM-5]
MMAQGRVAVNLRGHAYVPLPRLGMCVFFFFIQCLQTLAGITKNKNFVVDFPDDSTTY